MSKRTLVLIVCLTMLTAFFVYLAVSQNRPAPPVQTTTAPTKKPVPAYTTLMLSPATLTLSSPSGSLSVVIDTGKGAKTNKVTAVQLEMHYDPKMLTNVTITPGTFIPNAMSLPINSIDKTTGKITYELGIQPSGEGETGSGVFATIHFQSLLPKGGSTKIALLPTSLVTAQGVSESVLFQATGAVVTFGSPSPSVTVPPAAVQSTPSAQTP